MFAPYSHLPLATMMRLLPVFLTLLVGSSSSSSNSTRRTQLTADATCEEEAALLSTQQDRYNDFRDLQARIISKLDTIGTKTDLSLTVRVNCSASSQSLLAELATLKDLVQSLGRNVESITPEPTSCAAVQAERRRFGLPLVSGVYAIFVEGTLFRVHCDLQTDGGGWTVFQRRVDDDTDFFRSWDEYQQGFGDPRINYWMGNALLHLMTREVVSGRQDLRMELTDWNSTSHHVTYHGFSLGDETSRYMLSVGAVAAGNLSDVLGTEHHGKSFSTKDHFVNYGKCIDCPAYCQGAWWYGCCYYANLNGRLTRPSGERDHELARWYDANTKSYVHAKRTEMKFRPQGFNDV